MPASSHQGQQGQKQARDDFNSSPEDKDLDDDDDNADIDIDREGGMTHVSEVFLPLNLSQSLNT